MGMAYNGMVCEAKERCFCAGTAESQAVFLQGDVQPPGHGWSSARWEGEGGLAAALGAQKTGRRSSNSFHQLLTEVVLLHAEQQQLKTFCKSSKINRK